VKRNLSPGNIALILSATLTFLFIVLVALATRSLLWCSLGGIFLFAVSYSLSLYLIQTFIYRKIKLIYKTIHHLKSKKEEKPTGIFGKNDPLDIVKTEVSEWAEDQKKQMTILRDQERYRREFLANIGHELKTPIFSIQGYLHTLLDGAMEDEKVKLKFVQKAANNADRLQDLVEDLLAISKIEKGEVNINPSRFDICKLCKEIWERLELLTKEKKTLFRIKEGCDKPFFVNADKEEISKVLENLFSNSIKYGIENGTTTISIYNMGNNVLTEVTDDGEGIEEKDIPRLFERFYRAEKSRSREMGGTGLGLSIAKHIIESHNQTIHVRSTLGVGTTFGFTLARA